MSDWTWEYLSGAEYVVGGLTKDQREDVETLAQRITDAVGVRRIGHPFDIQESVSGVLSHGDGNVMVWYQEDYRDDVVLVLRAEHFLAD
ncbi:hypothetical protein [Streptomyces sp. NBC_00996]|uniref:hypothetical protein n=1 Tax=Streptomyces sp. NBC_00996 TaxID=2903710 RepID=UPI003862DDFC|nr:hypothetical protein OG390_18500 [Streptomyces sp. NBC_00996]